MPTVSLGIIPLMTERPAVASAGFWIFDHSLAALETPTASVEVTQPQEIDLYARMFAHLQAAAIYGPAARALIIKALAELMPPQCSPTLPARPPPGRAPPMPQCGKPGAALASSSGHARTLCRRRWLPAPVSRGTPQPRSTSPGTTLTRTPRATRPPGHSAAPICAPSTAYGIWLAKRSSRTAARRIRRSADRLGSPCSTPSCSATMRWPHSAPVGTTRQKQPLCNSTNAPINRGDPRRAVRVAGRAVRRRPRRPHSPRAARPLTHPERHLQAASLRPPVRRHQQRRPDR